VGDERRHHLARLVDRDGEPDPGIGLRLATGGDRGHDADDLASPVGQGSAGVAGVDGGVGLDGVDQLPPDPHPFAVGDPDHPVERRDDPGGDRALEAEGAADRDGGFADPEVGRAAEGCHRQAGPFDRAITDGARARQLWLRLGHRPAAAAVAQTLGLLRLLTGDVEEAEGLLLGSLDTIRRLGIARDEATLEPGFYLEHLPGDLVLLPVGPLLDGDTRRLPRCELRDNLLQFTLSLGRPDVEGELGLVAVAARLLEMKDAEEQNRGKLALFAGIDAVREVRLNDMRKRGQPAPKPEGTAEGGGLFGKFFKR